MSVADIEAQCRIRELTENCEKVASALPDGLSLVHILDADSLA
jgi:hypothetical protein